MELYERFESQRDRFEILAFHDRSVKDLEELDEKMQPIVEKAWGGKNLPFPTLLDSTGTTFRNFSIRTLGTAVLIDPEGNVVRGTAEEILEQALEEYARQGGDGPASPTETVPPAPGAGGLPGVRVGTHGIRPLSQDNRDGPQSGHHSLT